MARPGMLTDEEARRRLGALPGWELQDGKLHRAFVFRDFAEAFAFIHARSPHNAARWLRELYQSINGLVDFRGFARARECDWLGGDLRQKVFKSHRVVFSIDSAKRRMYVHYVRHAARRAAGEPNEESSE